MPLNRRHSLALSLALLAPSWSHARVNSPTVIDGSWTDTARQRTVPVRIRWPAQTLPLPAGGRPVVLFSHGLGGDLDAGTLWGLAWAAAGFVVLHLQHAGSDRDAVRQAAGRLSHGDALQELTGAEQLLARLRDVGFVLDEIGRRHRSAANPAWAGVRPQRVGMSGHSFGAHTTLGMAGQAYAGTVPMAEARLAAFAAFSPTLPTAGDPRQAFTAVTRPTLCLTGTRDGDVVGNGSTPERRRAVFDALPGGHKAMLVLQDADHMTFGGQEGRPLAQRRRDPATRQAEAAHRVAVAAITTDWWRAHLMNDAAAQSRLGHPRGLGAMDQWQTG
ncbi:MAG: dienelactone hydrolase [Burkholderiales bacterium]|nr:dienelactone hydrolase [Burkholderiales bacterium]